MYLIHIQGKTQVLSPALALILSDGSRSVTLITPRQLMRQSEDALNAFLCNPILNRPPCTFNFSRSTGKAPLQFKEVEEESLSDAISKLDRSKLDSSSSTKRLNVGDIVKSESQSRGNSETIRSYAKVSSNMHSLLEVDSNHSLILNLQCSKNLLHIISTIILLLVL